MTPVHMKQTDISLTIIGLVISVHILGMFAFSPLVGWLSDRLGRVRAIQIGVLLLVAASVFVFGGYFFVVEAMRRAGAVVGRFFEEVGRLVLPGVSTWDLEMFADRFIARHGVRSAFKGYLGFPAHLCTSLNEEVVHGIGSLKRILRDGDIISVDVTVEYNGYIGDNAVTVPVGSISPALTELLRVTEQALRLGVAAAVVGNRIGDISAAVQRYVESHGFSVVRDLVGHGVGLAMHEEPQIPNFGRPGSGERIKPGIGRAHV